MPPVTHNIAINYTLINNLDQQKRRFSKVNKPNQICEFIQCVFMKFKFHPLQDMGEGSGGEKEARGMKKMKEGSRKNEEKGGGSGRNEEE